MPLEKSELDTNDTGGGDHLAQCFLEGLEQPLHKSVIAVRFVEHAKAQQNMLVMGDLDGVRTPLTGT